MSTAVTAETLARLAMVAEGEWDRGGLQEAVGPVTLRDIPSMMVEHDASHREEIRALMGEWADFRSPFMKE